MNNRFNNSKRISKDNRNFNHLGYFIAASALVAFLGLIVWNPSVGASGSEATIKISADIWTRTERSAASRPQEGLPAEFDPVRLNKQALIGVLAKAPKESDVALRESQTVLSLPMPDGTFGDFRIQDAPILEPSMTELYPEIKSFRILGLSDPTMSGRFDLTPQGFHAIILADDQVISIMPADEADSSLYVSFANTELDEKKITEMCSMAAERLEGERPEVLLPSAPEVAVGPVLRTYRLAVAATWEYTNNYGPTTAATVASINTWVNSVNAIYERELSIRLILVNNTNVIYSSERGFNANNDPFTDGNDRLLLDESVTVMRNQIGDDNFNLGHVFTGGPAGRAGLGVVCGASKASGASVMGTPVGNLDGLLRVAHEIGHQFGAPHTFNSGRACNDNREADNGYESGSGTTIMSYAGTCPPDDVIEGRSNKELRFHARSIEQITNYVVTGRGSTCGTTSNTGNSAPVVTTNAAYNIPRNTPFSLTATANDPDPGDNGRLTYSWEQYDAGGIFTNPSYSDAGDPANTTRPIFRPFAPSANPTRTFPSLTYILNNANTPPEVINGIQTAEQLPRVGRNLNFRVSVRDNIGGVNDASTRLTVDGNSGPFRVTSPNTAVTLTGGANQNITWDVANTAGAPVSAANVKISLSTDGGLTFPVVLAASVPNSGNANVVIPNGINSTTVRIKIEAVGNVFFDISDTNFTVVPGDACPVASNISPKVAAVGSNVVITGTNFTGVTAVRFANNLTSTFTVNSNTQITATVPAGAVGGTITLSKPGCGDIQTGLLTVCSGAAVTLQVDNGVVGGRGGAGIRGGRPNIDYRVNRLTPASYPATLNAVSINISERVPVGTQINILVGTNPGGTANLGPQSLRATQVGVTAVDTYSTYQVEPITIDAGDFIVGYSYATGTNGANFDTSASMNRSYTSSDGVTYIQDNSNLMIRAQIFTGNCTPGACSYSIAPTNQTVPGTGGNGTITITTGANCPWTAQRSDPWISFTTTPTGNGNGTLNFTVAANPATVPRTGTITLGGKTYTINQEAGTPANNCNYLLNPGTANIGAAASAANTFAVATVAGCTWTAATTDNWINITGGNPGNGNGNVTYSVTANPEATARTGRITVGGQTFTVSQAGTAPVCNFTVTPAIFNLAGTAGAVNTFNIVAPAGCQWTAATNDNWIAVTGGATGNGNGTVTFSVTENGNTARVGTILAGGQAVAVNQAATGVACNFAVNPANALLAGAASEGNTFGVASPAGCAWAATANANWINITAGNTGTGNGTVTYSLAANGGPARTGTITAAGQTFTVNQSAGNVPCTPIQGGLLNWYRGENDVTDAIGTNTGTIAGTLTYGPGSTDRGMVFNGTNSVVSIQRRVSDNLTIEFWVNTISNGGTSETDWKQGAGIVAGDDFGVSLGNGKILFGVGDITVTSPGTVNDGVWYHVVASRERASGAMNLYIDGGNTRAAGTGGTDALTAGTQLNFGRRRAGEPFFNGTLDEVKIYDNNLTADQAQAAFAGCANAGRPGLVAANPAAGEGDTGQGGFGQAIIFTVRLTVPSNRDIAFQYETQDITAVAGVDYVADFGTVVIPAGATSATIPIYLIRDNIDEPDKQFKLLIYNPVGAFICDHDAVATIIDDDSPCEFNLVSPIPLLRSIASPSNSFDLVGPTGCTWTASSASSWITVTGGATGNGNGRVSFSVAQNTSVARTGYIVSAGQLIEVNQMSGPTAAMVSVSGRVLTTTGSGIRNALVRITNSDGVIITERTSSFGYYQANVSAGNAYVISVAASRYRFTHRLILVSDPIDGVNFIPEN